mmetsp:Transcript_25804/g.65037  ORF Transcript_25804/g.65037 Transcript_25804/m.65037 type:complete len:228 (-) Transcript_25804:33-716(-)
MMNETQLLVYRRYAMLHDRVRAQMLYGDDDGIQQASEALAIRNVIDYWAPGGEECSTTTTENPDEAMRSYSSVYLDDVVGTGYARSMLDSAQAWSAKQNQLGEWMQIALESQAIVAGVVTQGRHGSSQAVTEYAVQYSTDGIDWSEINADFQGSTSDEQLIAEFPSLVPARYIRMFPQSWEEHISMRAGLLLCVGSEDTDIRRLEGPASAPRSGQAEQEEELSLVEL